MFKFKDGWVETMEGQRKTIVVNAGFKPKLTLVAGVGAIAGGIALLLEYAFSAGADAYKRAEFNALNDLGLVNPTDPMHRMPYNQSFLR